MFDKRYQVSVTFFTVKKNFRTVECGYDEYEGTLILVTINGVKWRETGRWRSVVTHLPYGRTSVGSGFAVDSSIASRPCRFLIWNITTPTTFFFTIGGTMGCIQSCIQSFCIQLESQMIEDVRKMYAKHQHYPAYYHPDLYAIFHTRRMLDGWHTPWLENGVFVEDQGWIRNSPLRIELEDLLNGVLKAMGGWPTRPSYCFCYRCPSPSYYDQYHSTKQIEAQMVKEFNKVCKKFNDAKLFDTGLQCRAIMEIHTAYAEGASWDEVRMVVLVEKKDEEKLRDVDPFKYFSSDRDVDGRANVEEGLKPDWSPPENWMTRLTPPYNETTNHV